MVALDRSDRSSFQTVALGLATWSAPFPKQRRAEIIALKELSMKTKPVDCNAWIISNILWGFHSQPSGGWVRGALGVMGEIIFPEILQPFIGSNFTLSSFALARGVPFDTERVILF